jgi:alkylation response protein AidB-like acyl-CoA dehydrogenase
MAAILHERGWAAPAWPVEYGGCDWSLTQHYIFSRESTLAGAPSLSPMGIRMVAHAIIAFGTTEQKDFFLPRILTGEVFFCQGYSEPEAGSDLAALSMAAVDDGDDLVCTGSKIWTTHAGEANWMFGLVRTSRDGEEAAGHHVRADRHDVAGHPDPSAGDDLGREDPEPGLLRRGAGAQVQCARPDR